MTAKKFFAEVQKRLMEHLKLNRPESIKEEIRIGNFDQVLTILTALMERDARVQKDIDDCKLKMAEMAEEFGLSPEELENLPNDDDDENGPSQ